MKPYRLLRIVATLVLGTSALTAQESAGGVRLARAFGDGMVLQRGVPIPVWGWAAPRTPVTVALGGRVARATADGAGRWKAALPATPAGGPYTLSVSAGGARVDVRDVLVGDVWVASGQSNMELPVSVAANAAQEIAAAHDSSIRQLKVPVSWAEHPEDDLAGGAWAPADSQHVGAFSAVAYYFARELRRAERVPIGIVNTTWGGSAIETWLSAEAQGLGPDGAARGMAAERARLDSVANALRARYGNLEHDAGLVNGTAVWAAPSLDATGWARINVPAQWESQGYAGLDGVAWYRKTFTLSADEAARGATLSLGPIDDDDITWVNGVEVGRTNGYNVPRRYTVPASALRAGVNVIAVRVADGGGGGGIDGKPDELWLDVGGAPRPLAGEWAFRVGQLAMSMDGQRINKVPAVTYNKMVYPLLPMAIKGVIWYQGESNANDAQQALAYRGQFRTLITSWRRAFAGGAAPTFPFLWVQLPNFGQPDSVPNGKPAWAVQRESMAAALALPNTGQAVTIDIGEPGDIHPKNKQDVGKRLALVARDVAYGGHVLASGPTYRAHTVRGGRVIVDFANVGGGLVTRGPNGSVGAFAIAGADRKFVWAQARVEGSHVVVWSDQVPDPVAVRYAWANNPAEPNLYNKEGLPAAPFRTDTW
jgi:sialate O-acetylesterase